MLPDSRRKGMTLVETLIAGGLLLMVLTAAYSVLILALRYRDRNDDAVNNLREALVSVGRMRVSMAGGSAQSLISDTQGFAFVSALAPDGLFHHDPQGQLLWQKFVCFYVEDPGPNQPKLLQMKEKSFPETATLPDPTPAPALIIPDPTYTRTTLSANLPALTSFSYVVDSAADLMIVIKSPAQLDNQTTVKLRFGFRNS